MGTTPTAAPVVRADSSDSIAMIVEIVFALFGILGMGWLYAGNFLVSILAFVGSAILVFIEAGVIAVSFGFAACLVIPLNIVILLPPFVVRRNWLPDIFSLFHKPYLTARSAPTKRRRFLGPSRLLLATFF
jgi:hypothetical protein